MLVGSWDKADCFDFGIVGWGRKQQFLKSVFKSEHPRRATQTHEKHTTGAEVDSDSTVGKAENLFIEGERNKYK